jgi:hypothetical protein
MSGATLSGGTIPNNWTGTSGGTPQFDSFFGPGNAVDFFSGSGVSTAAGSVALTSTNSTVTVTGAATIDISAGSNDITVSDPGTIFAGPNDTISAAGAATLFGFGTPGVDAGTTVFSFMGADSSVTGGTGGIVGTSSGSNSTLVGGTSTSLFTITGANSLAVAGPGPGITGIDERGSSGAEEITTSPTGTTGPLVAFLGSGADTVVASGGASTVVGGAGADVFGFINSSSGGSEVILNFTARDNFGFEGFGSAGVIATESVGTFDGLTSDELTLTDGTKITLVGIDHKLF